MIATKAKNTEKLDPRVKRTRQLLVQAFADLIQEKSFQSITVQDITERATVNRATFYAHFEDKYDLMDYSIRDAFRHFLAARLPDDAKFNADNVRVLVLTVCEFIDSFYSHCAPSDQQVLLLMETNITGELYDLVLSWLKGDGAGPHSRGVPVEIAAVVTSWAIYGAAYQWRREKRPGTAKEFVKQVSPMILSGLSQSIRVPAS